MKRWTCMTAMVALGAGLLLAGCGTGDESNPGFRDSPPSFPSLALSTQLGTATASAGVVSGKVFTASSDTVDPQTGLPVGYGPLPDGDALVTATLEGSRQSWQAVIASGSYTLTNLPLGATLSITATKIGYSPRTQLFAVPKGGVGRLSFDYAGGAGDTYLLPQPGTH